MVLKPAFVSSGTAGQICHLNIISVRWNQQSEAGSQFQTPPTSCGRIKWSI